MNQRLSSADLQVQAAVSAIHSGDVAALADLLTKHKELATAYIGDTERTQEGRTLLHVATDWPGHLPRVEENIRVLVDAGADVDAPFVGAHSETPLHWAASSNDLLALEALLDAGAAIDAPGSVLGGGTPLLDARAFAQWDAARLLVQRGATTDIVDEATLGLMDRLVARFVDDEQTPSQESVNNAFWGACHGGSLAATQFLQARGAEINYLPPWERITPLGAAKRQGATEIVEWLQRQGGASVNELTSA